MTKIGLVAARDQIKKHFDETKAFLDKTLEEVSYEELKEAGGIADGLEFALVILNAHIEWEEKLNKKSH